MKKKTYMIDHISIKQVWLKENIILIKDVQKWVNQKLLKKPNEKKRLSIIYQRTKVQKLGSPKNERAKKTYLIYKMKTLNHIIIYNPMFSSVSSFCIYSPCCMTSNVQMVALHFNVNYICNKLFFSCALNPINT